MLTIIEKRSSLGPRKRTYEVPVTGGNLYSYIPDDYRRIRVLSVIYNGDAVNGDDEGGIHGDLAKIIPQDGDRISIAPHMGWVSAILFVVQVALALGAWALGRHQDKMRKHSERHARVGDSYAFDIMQNSIDEGNPIPVIYGTSRVGGQYLQLFTRQHEEGIDKLWALIGLSEGPVSAINPNGAADLHIDGNPSSNYGSITATSKIGTNSDSAIGDFRETVTTTGLNSQLLQGRANAVTVTGTVAADKAYVKITFITGLYRLDSEGHAKSASFGLEYRVDSGGGFGAWTSYTEAPFELVAGQTIEEILSGHYAFKKRRTTAFSIWLEFTHASSATWDIEISRVSSNHDASSGNYSDAYIKEYQEVALDDLLYPNLAKIGVSTLAQEQLSGNTPRITALVQGRKIMNLSSATAVIAPVLSNNPADVFLDILYNRRYGLGNDINSLIEITVSNIGGGPFTIDEVVKGPANDYQFKGIWRALNGTTAMIECIQGLPYTELEGETSSATCDIDSIDDAFATDLNKVWEFSQFCDEQVPDGSTVTTVDVNTASGQKVLSVAATTMFDTGDSVVIGYGTAREEDKIIDTIQAGVSITLTANLDYAHTAAQADEVSVAENRCEFDFVLGGTENGWDFLERICRVSRAFLARYAGRSWPRKLAAETPQQVVTEGNQGASSLTVSYRPKAFPNVFEAYYLDKDYDYRQKIVSIEAPELLSNTEKTRRIQLDFYGAARASQVSRETFFRGKRERYTRKHIKFMMGQEHIDFEPGDVFNYQHGMPGIGTGGGRVLSSTATTIELDHDVTVSGGEAIIVQHVDGTKENKTLTGTAGSLRIVTVTVAWGTNPSRNDLYLIGTPGQYRCLSLKPNQDNIAWVTAEEDDDAYYVDDFGTIPTFTESTLLDTNAMPSDVSGLNLAAWGAVLLDQTLQYQIQADFIPPEDENYHHAEIWVKELSGQQETAGATNFENRSGNGEFNRPRGLDSDGTYLYVADMMNDRIVKLNAVDLSFVANLGSSGTGNGQFVQPSDVATDGTNIWVADSGNSRVQKLTVAGAYVAKLGTSGAGADQFSRPFGICHDSNASQIYVADTYNHRMVLIDDPLVGSGGGTWTTLGANGAGADQFERPMGVCHNHANSLIYVADTGNNRLAKIDDALVGSGGGTWATIGSSGVGDDNFKFPTDVDCDVAGDYIWVADNYNHRYHLREDDMSYVGEVGQVGDPGHYRDMFTNPAGIAVYLTNLYIGEQGGNFSRVQRRDYIEGSAAGWVLVGSTVSPDQPFFRITDDLQGGEAYSVSVVSVGPSGVKKLPEDGVTDTITILPRTTVPPDVGALYAANAGTQVRLTWPGGTCYDFAGWEIRAGNTWASAQPIALVTELTVEGILVNGPTAGYSRTYYVAMKTTSNVYSTTPSSVTYTAPHTTAPIARSIGTNYAA